MNQLFLSTLLAQFWLAFLAVAAPVGDEIAASSKDNAWEYGTSGGIIGIIVLILDIIVFGTSRPSTLKPASPTPANPSSRLVEVLQSIWSTMSKLIWCLVVFLFPVIGMVVYWLFSNRVGHKRGAGYEALS